MSNLVTLDVSAPLPEVIEALKVAPRVAPVADGEGSFRFTVDTVSAVATLGESGSGSVVIVAERPPVNAARYLHQFLTEIYSFRVGSQLTPGLPPM